MYVHLQVILVSGSGHGSGAQTIIQRSVAVPVVRSGAGTYSSNSLTPVTPTHTGKTSIVVPSSLSLQASVTSPTTANGNLGNIVTVATSTTASTGQFTQFHRRILSLVVYKGLID